MNTFLDPSQTSLKICGVTIAKDAERLIELGVEALGVNFWSQSKRYINPEIAASFLKSSKGKIIRIGVFVNAFPDLPKRLLEDDLIDIIQFHGDESPEYCAPFANAKLPFIKAIGVKNKQSLKNIADYRANAILLDTPAPEVYGGTGEKFDWIHATEFIAAHPDTPVLLAGGITPDNAAEAIARVHPAALDVASGAELSPGIKDLGKVQALITSTRITKH